MVDYELRPLHHHHHHHHQHHLKGGWKWPHDHYHHRCRLLPTQPPSLIMKVLLISARFKICIVFETFFDMQHWLKSYYSIQSQWGGLNWYLFHNPLVPVKIYGMTSTPGHQSPSPAPSLPTLIWYIILGTLRSSKHWDHLKKDLIYNPGDPLIQ